MKLSKNQKGFSVIEGLLTLIALTLIGFVIFYVYNANKKTDESLNGANGSTIQQNQSSAGQASSAPQKAIEHIKYLSIKEYGVKVPLSQDLLDAKYRAETGTDVNGKNKTYIYVSSKTLDGYARACSNGTLHAESSNFIALGKESGTYKPSMDYGGLLKQFDGFFITGAHPNGTPCTSNDREALDGYVNKVAQLNESFTSDFKNASAIN
ncbi:MAG TPA: hypothetical protein VFW77_04885 [Candidatus Saccharimonadales bacterium]|nr:hypothetical protein [Candidatus Saccharimonadales bacterium]